ncbi:MAG: hypothetical protein JOZ07_06335 [Solirubrobacterales bacterium]|nr:hypothetical protein [Solirubrobacterales bacterium]
MRSVPSPARSSGAAREAAAGPQQGSFAPHIFATGSYHHVEINDPDLTISVIKLILDRARDARRG